MTYDLSWEEKHGEDGAWLRKKFNLSEDDYCRIMDGKPTQKALDFQAKVDELQRRLDSKEIALQDYAAQLEAMKVSMSENTVERVASELLGWIAE